MSKNIILEDAVSHRNRILAVFVQGCYHQGKEDTFPIVCRFCGAKTNMNLNPSTHEGFSKLLEFVILKTQDGEQYEEWAELFLFKLQTTVLSIGYKIPIIPIKFLNADAFANALYNYITKGDIK